MTSPQQPLRLPLNDFYTSALWSGVLSMTSLSSLYAALSTEGTSRLVLLILGATLGILSALLLLGRSWLVLDATQGTLMIQRGLGRPLWTSRHHTLEEIQRIELLKDASRHNPAALPLDENTPPPATYQTRLRLHKHTYYLPAWEEHTPAKAQAHQIATLLNLSIHEDTHHDTFRRSRRRGLMVALANATLVTIYAVYTVSTTTAPPRAIPKALSPLPEQPARTRALLPEETCARHDRLWAKLPEGWTAAIVLSDQGTTGIRVKLRTDPTDTARLIPRADVRIPDAKAARPSTKTKVKSKTYKRNLFRPASPQP